MPGRPEPSQGGARLTLRFALASAAIVGVAWASPSCGDNVIGYLGEDPAGGSGGAPTTPPLTSTDRIDVLFVVDDSLSMAEKQIYLADAARYLTEQLLNPPCLDAAGSVASSPESPDDACPLGQTRAHTNQISLHAGIVTTSLGSYGADGCDTAFDEDKNRRAHLVATSPSGEPLPTQDGLGFFAYDPTGAAGVTDPEAFSSAVETAILGVGQAGCGFEASLESWYRFLVDPAPYESLAIVDGYVVTSGVDGTILEQRAGFLRPDSLVAVVMLSDENDCSLEPTGYQHLLLANQVGPEPFHMPRARPECATAPNDPCCSSCAEDPAPGCGPAALCAESPTLTEKEDPINLRCFDTKRRFGVDWLYSIGRYADGLSSEMLSAPAGMTPNPLFEGGQRDSSMVVLFGIVGVPWQDIARDPTDLAAGFMSAGELAAEDRFDLIVGNPVLHVAANDPLMNESIDIRSGVHPIVGVPLAPPANPKTHPINGNERTIVERDDLQYACIFPLTEPIDCALGSPTCDCALPSTDNPLCQAPPRDPDFQTLQVAGKAYPSLRQLAVLEALGSQGVVSSICAAQTDEPDDATFGYRPAVEALLAKLRPRITGAP